MKLKLAQRLAISYYKAKFSLLAIFSKRKAAESVFELFCTPYSGKPKRKSPDLFAKAEVLNFKLEGVQLHGWRWKPAQPNGKKILIIHGFDSCSYKFDRYITPLNDKGFEVMAFDAPGHGLSGGKTINVLQYRKAIQYVDETYGKFYGIMAHSLGGLAAVLAFEQLPEQQSRKLVLIAPTTETTTAIDNFFRFMPVNLETQAEFGKLLEEVGQQSVSYYSSSRAVHNITAPILWVHDEEDLICPYCDTIPVQDKQLTHVEFFITKGLGHSGIYRNDKVFEGIVDFFVWNTDDTD